MTPPAGSLAHRGLAVLTVTSSAGLAFVGGRNTAFVLQGVLLRAGAGASPVAGYAA